MKTVFHKADSRGFVNHGWLQSRHTFNFGNYYHPERTNFGALRVLNDDRVAEAKGFGTHPHRDMEIISIPLAGDLEHKDSMGTTAVIKQGDVQVMSAGTGITHSEYNANADQPVEFLQIWIIPNQMAVTPRYDQVTLDATKFKNNFQQVVSPNPEDEGVWIHQNAWFHLIHLDAGKSATYHLKDPIQNGVYLFNIYGEVNINDQSLQDRDGYGIWETSELEIFSNKDSKMLCIEVPMLK